jgi:hypothetical protein
MDTFKTFFLFFFLLYLGAADHKTTHVFNPVPSSGQRITTALIMRSLVFLNGNERKGYLDEIKSLLPKVDVNQYDSWGNTFLSLAVLYADLSATQLLLKAERINVNKGNKDTGRTPLMNAVWALKEKKESKRSKKYKDFKSKLFTIVDLLFFAGADLDKTDKQGNTAVSFAQSQQVNSFIELFAQKTLPECSICFEGITKKKRKNLSCNHRFHKNCINKWFGKQKNCPECRDIV